MKIAAICGSFHKKEIQKMLEYAENQADSRNCEISEIVDQRNSWIHTRVGFAAPWV